MAGRLRFGNYDPFGLTMAGISSKAAGTAENKYEYNLKKHLDSDIADLQFYYLLRGWESE
jgi:hypothetical protein